MSQNGQVMKSPYYIEEALRKDLDFAKHLVFKGNDEDIVFIIDGRERSGKSVLGMQIAKYLDPSFDVDSICLTVDEFVQFVKNNTKRVVIFDESILGFNSKRSTHGNTIYLDELLAMSGQKNLITILITPSFFELTRRVALSRSEFLIHVVRDEMYRRGYYHVYPLRQKRMLYMSGKKLFEYEVKGVSPAYRGRFYGTYPVDEEAYRRKKGEAFDKFLKVAPKTVPYKKVAEWIGYSQMYALYWAHDSGYLKPSALSNIARDMGLSDHSLYSQKAKLHAYVAKNELDRLFDVARKKKSVDDIPEVEDE